MGKDPDDLSLFPLSDKDWNSLFLMARWQTVTGIVYRGVCRLPDNLMPPHTILLKWTVATDRVERRNRQVNKVLTALNGIWEQKKAPILQKGQGVALFYEQPLLRESGDIDLYFQKKQWTKQAVSTICNMGIALKKRPDGSIFFQWKGVDIEIHTRLTDLYNPFVQSYLKKLETKENRMTGYWLDRNQHIQLPSPMMNLLIINSHIMKHALGRGIGLRQLCDMARACYCLHGQVSASTMEQVAHRTGMKKWNRLIHAFMTEYLGLPDECLPYPEKKSDARSLWNIVWKGGNFGMYPDGMHIAKKDRRTGKLQTLRVFYQNMLFSLRYAPKELIGLIITLISGQIHSLRK